MSSPTPMAEKVLELKGVKAAYGRIEVLHGVNLVVPAGSVVALLGPNGGGKTTTLKVIGGEKNPPPGRVHLPRPHPKRGPNHRPARPRGGAVSPRPGDVPHPSGE